MCGRRPSKLVGLGLSVVGGTMPGVDATVLETLAAAGAEKLDGMMRRALAQLELVGHGATSRYGGHVAFGDDGAMPNGTRDAPHEFFRRRYLGCATDDQRARVVHDAFADLRRFRKTARGISRRRATPEEIGHDKRHVSVVADEHGISQAMVYRLRRDHAQRAA